MLSYPLVQVLFRFNANSKLFLASYFYRFNVEDVSEGKIKTVLECLLRLFTILELVDMGYAADAAKRVRYDTDYLTIFNSAVDEYKGLLAKYQYPEEEIEDSVHFMICKFLMGRVEVFRQISINEGGPEEIPEMPADDIDNFTMAMIFANLPPQPDVAAYLKEINVNYDYDHLHMVTWFSAQMHHGRGNYSRTEHNYSAKTTYNRLLNPYSLMWIAAALGEDPEVVRKAAAEAEKVKSYASKCGAVRREIPFDRILDLAVAMFDELFSESEE